MMNTRTLIKRSLIHFRRSHLWIVLGTALGTAVLTGALAIGDSVRGSLRQIVFERLGRTEFALAAGDRLFRSVLADDLARRLGTPVAPLLQARGIAAAGGGERRANRVQILGVDERFGGLGDCADFYRSLQPGEAVVNPSLAERLRIRIGDEILLRLEKAESFPKDAPLAPDTKASVAKRFKVKAIASAAEFGRFNLKADQVAPLSVFVSISDLAKAVGAEKKANVLLVANRPTRPLKPSELQQTLQAAWTLADAGLDITDVLPPGMVKGRAVELKSPRIFLEPAVVRAALATGPGARPILTYFVNSMTREGRSAPYSFVSAPGPPAVASDMDDGEILINDWLARDLGAGAGDSIRLTYYVLGPTRNLSEATAEFRVKAVVPIKGVYADKALMPDLPGLADKLTCRDWDPGLPVDLKKVRVKDEDYWDAHKGTPKAFVTLRAAQNLWRNRFGDVTAVRFPGQSREDMERRLLEQLDPVGLGFSFREVKAEGLRAGGQSVDFAGLFLGLSSFVILAALLLTALLFVFHGEQRAGENGLLLALGFPRKRVLGIVLAEGGILIGLGSLAGGATGILYNQAVLTALKTVWRGAVGTSILVLHVRISSLVLGIGAGAALAFVILWRVASRQVRRPIAGTQAGLSRLDKVRTKIPRASLAIGLLCWTAVIGILFATNLKSGANVSNLYFASGFCLLAGSLASANLILWRMARRAGTGPLSLGRLGIRNTARQRLRSLALLGILAAGVFIVFTVGANRKSAPGETARRESGTGGFALYGESALPALYDLNSPKGARLYGLDKIKIESLRIVQFRVLDGDDASCLNLNRVSSPRLAGVDPAELSRRGAFAFVTTAAGVDRNDAWTALDMAQPDGAVPAIADQTVITWGLGKKTGDTLSYMDETGQEFKVRLVGGLVDSLFQGNLIISEKNMLRKHPSQAGYRLFLIDAPASLSGRVADDLAMAMEDQGLDVVPAAGRLAAFNAVQNTYLSIFLMLGALGLMLGSLGIGIIVRRTVAERRGELALLQAVGFSRKAVRRMVLAEHMSLGLAGIAVGILSSLLASLPSLLAPGSDIPYAGLALFFILVLVNVIFWAGLAVRGATREDILPALRNE